MNTLQSLFVQQLKDAYSAETQLLAALPKMADAAHSEELQQGFRDHLRETREQIKRLERACTLVDCEPGGKTCEAMRGLVEEGQEAIGLDADELVRDAALIGAAQKVEHYEIALYGTLCSWAEELGLRDVQHLLKTSLEEEKAADMKLTKLAEGRVNALARR